MQRISGPLLDRIDMHIDVPSVEYEAMRRKEQPEPSSAIRERVNAAREVQKKRFAGTEVSCNAYMTPAMIGQYCALDAAGEKLMQGAFERLGLTARSHDRILRMARTIADLEGATGVLRRHIAEALIYRRATLGAEADFDRSAGRRGDAPFGLREGDVEQAPFAHDGPTPFAPRNGVGAEARDGSLTPSL